MTPEPGLRGFSPVARPGGHGVVQSSDHLAPFIDGLARCPLNIDEHGTVTNTDAAHQRAAQWIRARCDLNRVRTKIGSGALSVVTQGVCVHVG